MQKLMDTYVLVYKAHHLCKRRTGATGMAKSRLQRKQFKIFKPGTRGNSMIMAMQLTSMELKMEQTTGFC